MRMNKRFCQNLLVLNSCLFLSNFMACKKEKANTFAILAKRDLYNLLNSGAPIIVALVLLLKFVIKVGFWLQFKVQGPHCSHCEINMNWE